MGRAACGPTCVGHLQALSPLKVPLRIGEPDSRGRLGRSFSCLCFRSGYRVSGLHEEWVEAAQAREAEPEAELSEPATDEAALEPPAEAEAEAVVEAEPPAPEQISSGHRFNEVRRGLRSPAAVRPGSLVLPPSSFSGRSAACQIFCAAAQG